MGTSCSVLKHGTSTAPFPVRAAWEEGAHSGGIPSLSLAGESSRECWEQEPPHQVAPALLLRRIQSHWSAPCSCTRFGFSQNLWLWAWGVGFPVSCNMEGFLCLDFFTGYYVFCADCCLHSLFFLFFSGTTQEGSHCKRGGSLMGGMVLWPVCSQTKK